MKKLSSMCLALVVGFVLGTLARTVVAKADSPTTVYLDEVVASGTKQSHTINGTQVVGFSCGPGMTGVGMDCYVLSTK
jgi:hypothetical protein